MLIKHVQCTIVAPNVNTCIGRISYKLYSIRFRRFRVPLLFNCYCTIHSLLSFSIIMAHYRNNEGYWSSYCVSKKCDPGVLHVWYINNTCAHIWCLAYYACNSYTCNTCVIHLYYICFQTCNIDVYLHMYYLCRTTCVIQVYILHM